MINQYLITLVPLAVAIFIYLMRLEARLATILTDIKWIKERIAACQPTSEKASR